MLPLIGRILIPGDSGDYSCYREISEYKAISFLDKFAGGKWEYKTWTKKLKNALVQSRGVTWKLMLEQFENHHVSEDFEELISLDDRWDEWFEKNHGTSRTDGL